MRQVSIPEWLNDMFRRTLENLLPNGQDLLQLYNQPYDRNNIRKTGWYSYLQYDTHCIQVQNEPAAKGILNEQKMLVSSLDQYCDRSYIHLKNLQPYDSGFLNHYSPAYGTRNSQN
jgi:hypothetical protein